MSTDVIINLLQIILLTVATVVVMLVTAFKRDHGLISGLTIFGLVVALMVFTFIEPILPLDATPLLIIDEFSLFYSGLVILGGIVVAVLAYPYFENHNEQNEEFYLLLLMATLGGVVLACSQHFVSFLIGMETLSIALYAMIAYPIHTHKSSSLPLEASIKYLILSAAASAIMLFGIAMLYAYTGTLAFAEVPHVLAQSQESADSVLVMLGLLMILSGVAFKLSLVPFHLWTPDVYEGAPVPVTAYIATVSKAAMLAVVVRAVFMTDAYQFDAFTTSIMVMAAISMVVGNLLALLQTNVKRLLAYSSIAHLGYLMVAIVAGATIVAELTVETVSYYVAAYVLTSLAGFAAISAVSNSSEEKDTLSQYQGLFWKNPWLAIVLTTVLLSLAGIPLTMGFIGKFYIINAAVEGQLWVLLALLVIGSGIGLYYYLKLIYLMLQNAPEGEEGETDGVSNQFSIPVGVNISLALLTTAIIYYGVYPTNLIARLQSLAGAF